jgi:hypothetical protein
MDSFSLSVEEELACAVNYSRAKVLECSVSGISNKGSWRDANRPCCGARRLIRCSSSGHSEQPTTLLLSDDNAAPWRHSRGLETEPGEYSYPSIIPITGGVAVVYTWRHERIACWMGPVP